MKTDAERIPGYMLALMILTAAAITAAGVIWKQSFLRILPLYISLFVGLFQTRASRYAVLIGGVNSLLYAAVFFFYRVYGSAAQALLVSFPIQMWTFIRWKRHAYGESTVFRSLTGKQRAWITAGFVLLCAAVFAVLSAFGSQYRVLDTLVTLLGLLTPILTLLAFIEYTWLQLVAGVLVLALYVQMLGAYPEQMTYLIYAVYSLICMTLNCVRVRALYIRQQTELKGEG